MILSQTSQRKNIKKALYHPKEIDRQENKINFTKQFNMEGTFIPLGDRVLINLVKKKKNQR